MLQKWEQQKGAGWRRREEEESGREGLKLSMLFAHQVHAYIISSLKKEMPSVFGKDNKKKELVNNLADIYGRIEREHQISPGDFPNLKRMQVSWAMVGGGFRASLHGKPTGSHRMGV